MVRYSSGRLSAAQRSRIRIGVYVDALEKLGPDAAAVAIMITAERHSRSEIRLTPGAYFTGMIGKAKRDELDLAKSLWGFGPNEWQHTDKPDLASNNVLW
ncbi:hypothetical protein GCM10020258_56670 [Sphingomonas yabuuchiae]